MESRRFSFSNFNDRIYAIVGVMILTVLVLTAISFFGLCSEECAEGHKYRIFGLPFELFGLLFFGALAIGHILSRWIPLFGFLVSLGIAGAVGAEGMFILFQKYVIGHWCPVCLSIAACVFIAAAALGISYLKEKNTSPGGRYKEKKMRGFASTAVIFIGFLASFLGVTKYDAMLAAENSIKESLEFGVKSSPIEAYLFTDWACPACRKLEGNLESLVNAITKEASFVFVDHAIHPETLNFTPFNLSFMINNKPQYFKLRHMLTAISEQTGSPNEDEIREEAKRLGVNYIEIPYSQVTLGIDYFKALGEQFKIEGTPTLVIINRAAKKGKKFAGNDELTQENALNAIKTLKEL